MIKYETKITSNMKNNPKMFFAYVNSKRKVRQSVVSVKHVDGEMSKSPQETADIIASFFETTFIQEPLGPLPQSCYGTADDPDSDLVIDPSEVRNALSRLDVSKSMGPDGIHPKVLVSLAENSDFVKSLTDLYNACIKEGKIPKVWKVADVTPIHKKGSKADAANYRPISLTSILCKIYEKFVRDNILDHVKDRIAPQQHGFMHGKSCL